MCAKTSLKPLNNFIFCLGMQDGATVIAADILTRPRVCVFAQPLASVGCPTAEWKGAEQ